ncbi:MAG TPA: MmgE/PrpD family protein [Acidimicrobiales bacterium]|nr:MmgE/PrpD family protein [Acidimicrobiales bacterium]
MNDLSASIASVCAGASISSLGDATIEHAVCALDRVLSLAVTRHDDPLVMRIDAALGGQSGARMIEGIGPSRKFVPGVAVMTIAAAAALELSAFAYSERVLSVIVPPAFVAAQLSDCDGEGLVLAVAFGCEVAYRVRLALGESHERRGWDPVGTAGRLGATCAVAIALGLNGMQIHDALGFACTMAAGIRVAGDELRAFGAGKAAADALEAATLAREGLIGPPEPIAGRRGFFALTAPAGDPNRILEGLGERWHDFERLAPLSFGEDLADIVDEPNCQSLVEAFHVRIEREISG